MQTNDGLLTVVSGTSRTGKSAWTAEDVKDHERVIAWDPEDQWSRMRGWDRITRPADLVSICQRPGPIRAGFVAGGDMRPMFDLWAGCMMYAGRYVEPLTAIAEEVADVTTPSKAPGKWGVLIRRGLKRGINIYAISQRWAEADKTAMGNAGRFVCFAMSSRDDVRYLARKTRISESELDALEPFEFVEADRLGRAQRRTIEFVKGGRVVQAGTKGAMVRVVDRQCAAT